MNEFSSHQPRGRGGPGLGRWAKARCLFVARLVTDDAEFPLAMVMRNDEAHKVRIVACVGSMRRPPTEHNPHRGSEWGPGPIQFQHFVVDRNRITEFVRIS